MAQWHLVEVCSHRSKVHVWAIWLHDWVKCIIWSLLIPNLAQHYAIWVHGWFFARVLSSVVHFFNHHINSCSIIIVVSLSLIHIWWNEGAAAHLRPPIDCLVPFLRRTVVHKCDLPLLYFVQLILLPDTYHGLAEFARLDILSCLVGNYQRMLYLCTYLPLRWKFLCRLARLLRLVELKHVAQRFYILSPELLTLNLRKRFEFVLCRIGNYLLAINHEYTLVPLVVLLLLLDEIGQVLGFFIHLAQHCIVEMIIKERTQFSFVFGIFLQFLVQ